MDAADELVRRMLLPCRSAEEWLKRITDAYAILAAMIGAIPYSREQPGVAARGMLIHYLARVDQWITLAYHQLVDDNVKWGE